MSARDEEPMSGAQAGPSRSRNTTAQGSSTTSERQEYTSLSSLGVGVPKSPHGSGYGGNGRNGSKPRWLAKRDGDKGGFASALYMLSELLHPAGGRDAPREGDDDEYEETSYASTAQASRSTRTAGSRPNERTSLLGTNISARRPILDWLRSGQRQQAQPQTPAQAVAAQYGALNSTSSLRRKYVGACCCDPLEPITMQDWQARQGSSSPYPAQHMSTETLVNLRVAHAETMHTAGVSLATVAQISFALMALLAARYSTVLSEDRVPVTTPGDSHLEKTTQHVTPNVWAPASVWLSRMWISLSVWLFCSALIRVFRVPGGLFGPKKARTWIWSRALVSTGAVTCFTIAAGTIPMADLVVVIYLAPILFVLASHLFFTSSHPFRAQLVSLSIYLGLILVMQPTFLFFGGTDLPSLPGNGELDDFFDGDGVPAMPLDSPTMSGLEISTFAISPVAAWLAASASVLLSFVSLAMLDRRPDGPITYQSVAANSLVLAIASAIANSALSHGMADGSAAPRASTIPTLSSIAMLGGTAFFSLAGQVFQDLGSRYTAMCQMGLISFLQPVISTGFGFILPNLGSDPLCLAGVVLILANVAWTWTPLSDDEILEEYV